MYTPEDIIHAEFMEIRSAGLSNQKTQYVKNIAEYFVENELYQSDWNAISDEDILSTLTEIKGVGEWTAQMILIFELHRENIFPVKDLGIQIAMKNLYSLKEEKRELIKRMEKISEIWAPYRSLASLYLWAWKRENP